ncbi:MAG TPA: GNAT family N-acetyltransferase [Candidatus Limnocylindria bacterium]|nr:GNAT family N-acetyltransferase [Candidatus Limnocylindria bacterium]
MDPLADADWDTTVSKHPDATFFHSASWAATLKETYGFPCRYIVAMKNGELRGLLPIMEARSWLRRARGVSLPFTDECPPLVSPDVSAESLFEFAVREGNLRGWKYLELRGGYDCAVNAGPGTPFLGHRLALISSSSEIFEKFESAVRRAVRKAERAGVTVRFGTDLQSVRAYYRLHCRTRTRHGAPPQPFRFFQSLCQRVLEAGHGFVALAIYNEKPIAGAVFLQFARRAIYKFSASDERSQEHRGANVVIWKAICKLADAGAAELNFGKTSMSNEGLRRFKQGWGTEEYPIHYARYSFARRSFVKVDDLASGAQARAFAVLPVIVSKWIGRAVYPHLN